MAALSEEAMKALQDMMDNAIKKALKERDEERESSSDEENLDTTRKLGFRDGF